MRHFSKAAADSSQRARLVIANGPAVANNREQGRHSVEHLYRLEALLRRLLGGRDGGGRSAPEGGDNSLGNGLRDSVHCFLFLLRMAGFGFVAFYERSDHFGFKPIMAPMAAVMIGILKLRDFKGENLTWSGPCLHKRIQKLTQPKPKPQPKLK
jgi:hypothetical protein